MRALLNRLFGLILPKESRRQRPTRLAVERLEDRTVPTMLGQQLYPSDYAWNQKVTDAPVAATSAGIMNNITTKYGNGLIHPDFSKDLNTTHELYGIPYNIVHSSTTPKVNVVIDGYPDESDLIPAPIPATVVIEGDRMNGPASKTSREDSHLIVWDADTNIAYEFFHASRPSENTDGKWHADGQCVFDMKTNSFRTIGWTSADASGMSILAGLIRPDEALPVSQGGQGVINHAIRFTLNNDLVLNKFIYPASHIANTGTNQSVLAPMGSRFRLKASVDISNLNPQSRIIAQAMKDYGMLLADNGGNFFPSGASASVDTNNNETLTWNDNDIHDSVRGLKSLRFGDFEVVDLTPKVTDLSVHSGSAGTSVTVAGQNFSGAAGRLQVLFGSTPATSVTYVDDSHIIAVAPNGTGTVDVRVQSGVTHNSTQNIKNPVFGYGTSAINTSGSFTFGTSSNQAPTVVTVASGSPSLVVTGTTTTLSALGADDGGEANLIYTWAVLTKPTGATNPTFSVNGTNAAKSSVATFSMAGAYQFQVTIRDAQGLTVTSNASVTYQPNQAPTVATAAGGTPNPVVTGNTTTLSVLGADDGGAANLIYTWAVTSKPTGATNPTFSVNGTNAAKSSVATFTQAGAYGFQVTIRDAQGLTVTSNTSVTYQPNQAPTVATAAGGTPNPVITGNTTTLSVLGADDGGEANLIYTWAVTSKPTGATDPTFSVNGTNGAKSSVATFTQAGAYGFQVTIRDAQGLTVTSNASVTYQPNLAPTVATAAGGTPNPVITGNTTTLSVLGADDGGEANLIYTWAVISKPTGATNPTFSVNGTNAAKSSVATFTQAGAYGFQVTIRDAQGLTVTSNASVNYQPNQGPTVATAASANPSTIVTGTTSSLSALGADDGGEANLTYTWLVAVKPTGATDPTFSVNGTNAAKSTVATFTQAGTYQFQVTIRDAQGLTATSSVGVTYQPNQAPTVATASTANPTTVVSGTTSSLSVLGTDDGGEANLIYTWAISSKPAGATDPTFSVNGTNAAKNTVATFTTAGAYQFQVTIRDAQGLTTTSSVGVSYQPIVNQAPTVATAASANPSTIITGTTSSLSVLGADDAGEASLTYTWAVTSKPTGATNPTFSVNGTNAAKSSVATFTQAGAYGFQVTIRDAQGLTATSNVSVSYQPNQGPTVATAASANPSTVVTGTTSSLSALGADDGGEANLTYTWLVAVKPTGATDPTFSVNGTNAAKNTVATFTTAGTYQFQVTIRDVQGVTATSSVGVTYQPNQAPTVATAASANPTTVVTGTTSSLSVLGADDAGEAALSYTWAVTSKPSGATDPTFSVNGTNAAKSAVATFTTAGAYQFQVTIRDAQGLSATSSVSVLYQPNQGPIVATAANANPSPVVTGTNTTLSTMGDDDGGEQNLTYTWACISMPTGATWPTYSANGSNAAKNTVATFAQAGAYQFRVTIRDTHGMTATSNASVTFQPNQAPSVATAASASPSSVVTGNTTTLSVLGADDAGEASLTYTWTVASKPTGATNPTFSVNGTNASKSTVVTFTTAGNYQFQVTIRDAQGLTVASSVSASFQPTTNSPPVIGPLANVTVPHTAGTTTVAFTASDPDSTLTAASFSVTTKSMVKVAYEVGQQRSLTNPGSNYYFNARGVGEKYVVSTDNTWYFMMPDTKLYQWTGSISGSTVVANLDSAVYDDPAPLWSSTPPAEPALTTSVTATGGNNYNLTIGGFAGYVGKIKVTMSATDGSNTDTEAFTLVLTNNAPTLQPVASTLTVDHASSPSVALIGGDDSADVANLNYSVKVYKDDAIYQAYKLAQSKGFQYPGANFYYNARGKGEKYLMGDGSQWYYVMPTGDLHQWATSMDDSPLVATLPSVFANDPYMLLNVTLADVSSTFTTISGNGTTAAAVNFSAEALKFYAGTLHVQATVSDGFDVSTLRAFDVVVTNNAPTVQPVASSLTFSHTATTLPTVTLSGSDDAGDITNLAYSAKVYLDSPTYQAYTLDQASSFANPGSNYYFNVRGMKEKYLVGAGNQYYYILPTGEVYRWGGSVASSTLKATLNSSFWSRPELLWNAQAPAVADQAYSLRQTHGFSDPGSNYYFNARGLREKYLQGNGGQWYFILQDGSLYQWSDSVSSSVFLAKNKAFYDTPSLLTDAQPIVDVSATYVTLSGDGTTNGKLKFVTTAIRNFTGTLHVVVGVSDGIAPSVTQSFDVIVS